MSEWRDLSARPALESPWLRVTQHSFMAADGRRIPEYYIVERPDSAICVCRVGVNVLLVRQYRPGIAKSTLCHPGGRLEPGDDSPLSGAMRELLEETGLSPHTVTALGAFAQIPAVETARVHIFLVDCTDDGDAVSSPEPGEDLTTELVPIAQLDELVTSGGMDCVACVAASYKLLLTAVATRADN